MKCLHGELCAQSTTQNGSFWFCNQSPSCNFFCSKDKSYTYEKSTKQPHPRCEKHGKLAKMHVVKNLLKSNYGDPSSCVPTSQILVPSGFGAMYNT